MGGDGDVGLIVHPPAGVGGDWGRDVLVGEDLVVVGGLQVVLAVRGGGREGRARGPDGGDGDCQEARLESEDYCIDRETLWYCNTRASG